MPSTYIQFVIGKGSSNGLNAFSRNLASDSSDCRCWTAESEYEIDGFYQVNAMMVIFPWCPPPSNHDGVRHGRKLPNPSLLFKVLSGHSDPLIAWLTPQAVSRSKHCMMSKPF